jgi:hypothetical protein
MITHEELLAAVIEQTMDYKPWGIVEREQGEDFLPDCSSGCKFFAELEGKVGYDWGVCTNPKSHRCGLLTFEHQGCPQFELSDEEEENGPRSR